uniref:Uncharacterized protein n=1 Tax=Thermosporothrix sp. COM3 TaxID=2490863 RepID=A0A455SX57_9CHLR|nr:hypothetical protein KTC_65020 [Thermosporothrix sp. COM3]
MGLLVAQNGEEISGGGGGGVSWGDVDYHPYKQRDGEDGLRGDPDNEYTEDLNPNEHPY